jgi:transcriptional regulator with XRE-family HTH domain
MPQTVPPQKPAADQKDSTLRGRVILARNVHMERVRRRLSQEALGDLCHVSRVHIGSIERGEVACSIDVIERLAKALNVEMSALLHDH